MNIHVKTLNHVTIVSSDLDRTRAFYVGLLGMKEVPRPAFPFPGLWFQAGLTEIHVNITGAEAGPAGVIQPRGTRPSRGHHIAFEVDDADAAAAHCAAQGLELAAGPMTRPDGPRQMYIYDPDGYLIELYSYPPGWKRASG